MPSDEITTDALAAVAAARDDYRSALVGTVDQLRGLLLAQSGQPDAAGQRAASELGSFAAGHIDAERFASLFAREDSLDDASRSHLERAIETLESLAAAGDDLFVCRVPAGGDLRDTVIQALGETGRAFGAARTAELARTGRFRGEEHRRWIDHFPPELWSAKERELSPPLVVRLRGAELRVGGVSELLDGSQKLVLLVEGKAPPAALVRCITPGVHVIQTSDREALSRIGDTEGAAIIALLPDGAAVFEHRPGVDGASIGRLSVEFLPDQDPNRAIGHISVFQQSEELEQLRVLMGAAHARPGANGTDAGVEPAAATDADILAAWILRQGGQGAA